MSHKIRRVEPRPFPGMIPELADCPVYLQIAHPKCVEDPEFPGVALCGRPLPFGFRIKSLQHLEIVRRDKSLKVCETCLRCLQGK